MSFNMLTIFKLVNVLNISDTTIGYPSCHLCSKFYVQFVRQISNIHTHGFLLKCKNHIILPTDQSKLPKKR